MIKLDELKALKEIDLKSLDLDSISAWPMLAKAILCFILMLLVMIIGYQFDLRNLQDRLSATQHKERALKKELLSKAEKAANLDAYRAQIQDMKKNFAVLVHQLPEDTEVPSLLEDITQIGRGAGLEFENITLLPEQNREFFVELPIRIDVSGKYHDIGTFVSGVSSLQRIVTLHNFSIHPNDSGELKVEMLAKTYRYKDEGSDDAQ